MYCKECYSLRKANNTKNTVNAARTTNAPAKPLDVPVKPSNTPAKPFTDVTPKAAGSVQVYPIDQRSAAEKERSAARRLPVARRRIADRVRKPAKKQSRKKS